MYTKMQNSLIRRRKFDRVNQNTGFKEIFFWGTCYYRCNKKQPPWFNLYYLTPLTQLKRSPKSRILFSKTSTKIGSCLFHGSTACNKDYLNFFPY